MTPGPMTPGPMRPGPAMPPTLPTPPSRPVSAAVNTSDLGRLRQLRRAKDLMDSEWSGPADVPAVAAHAGYSTYHFIRAFRETYGRTPGQYLTLRRVERAQEMLRTANLSVTEICALVGFSSLGTFSSTFKRLTGATPTEYRDRHHRRAEARIPSCFILLHTGGLTRAERGNSEEAG